MKLCMPSFIACKVKHLYPHLFKKRILLYAILSADIVAISFVCYFSAKPPPCLANAVENAKFIDTFSLIGYMYKK